MPAWKETGARDVEWEPTVQWVRQPEMFKGKVVHKSWSNLRFSETLFPLNTLLSKREGALKKEQASCRAARFCSAMFCHVYPRGRTSFVKWGGCFCCLQAVPCSASLSHMPFPDVATFMQIDKHLKCYNNIMSWELFLGNITRPVTTTDIWVISWVSMMSQ